MLPTFDAGADVDEYSLTISHVAQQLKKSEATIRRMYERGELPGVRRSNGERWFRQSDVDAVQQHRREGLARAGGGRGELDPPDAA
jgi:excisionase family DNA binding protein